jgi:hypothetical protein
VFEESRCDGFGFDAALHGRVSPITVSFPPVISATRSARVT